MKSLPVSRSRIEAGFTLIEILVVISIIAILLVILTPMVFRSRTEGERKAIGAVIQNIRVAIKAYRDNPRYGDSPPTSAANALWIPKGANLTPNDINLGIESLILHFHHKDFDSESPFASQSKQLKNTDEPDMASINVTSFGTNELFEFVDPWGNPLVYFRLRDFTDRKKTQKIQLADGTILSVAPIWDDKLNRFAGYDDGFQVLSLGPDRKYGTDDDVRSFD